MNTATVRMPFEHHAHTADDLGSEWINVRALPPNADYGVHPGEPGYHDWTEATHGSPNGWATHR